MPFQVGHVENTNKIPIKEGNTEGCRFEGKFYINKVPGNFHISTHAAINQPDIIDMSHTINELHFGNDLDEYGIEGGFHTLRGRHQESPESNMTISQTFSFCLT